VAVLARRLRPRDRATRLGSLLVDHVDLWTLHDSVRGANDDWNVGPVVAAASPYNVVESLGLPLTVTPTLTPARRNLTLQHARDPGGSGAGQLYQ
jgi:hypothetical protein